MVARNLHGHLHRSRGLGVGRADIPYVPLSGAKRTRRRGAATSAHVKGSRTPAADGRPPHRRAAGVREASGEETAGRVRSVVPRAMGIVALAVVARPARLFELGQPEALGERAGGPKRGISRVRA